MVKPIDTPFPSDLIENEWKPLTKTTGEPNAEALTNITNKGYHLFENDMSAEYGAEESPSDEKH